MAQEHNTDTTHTEGILGPDDLFADLDNGEIIIAYGDYHPYVYC